MKNNEEIVLCRRGCCPSMKYKNGNFYITDDDGITIILNEENMKMIINAVDDSEILKET